MWYMFEVSVAGVCSGCVLYGMHHATFVASSLCRWPASDWEAHTHVLGAHGFENIKATIKISSTENGIIFGNVGKLNGLPSYSCTLVILVLCELSHEICYQNCRWGTLAPWCVHVITLTRGVCMHFDTHICNKAYTSNVNKAERLSITCVIVPEWESFTFKVCLLCKFFTSIPRSRELQKSSVSLADVLFVSPQIVPH